MTRPHLPARADAMRMPTTGPIQYRFWPRVNLDGPMHPYDYALGRCWLWTGRGSRFGYGLITRGTKNMFAHRLAWEFAHGPIAAGAHVLHSCDRRRCVKPAHLFLGDQAANMKDAAAKGRFHVPRPNHRKFSDEQIAEMRALRSTGLTLETIGARFGAGSSFVSQVIRGTRRQFSSSHDRTVA